MGDRCTFAWSVVGSMYERVSIYQAGSAHGNELPYGFESPSFIVYLWFVVLTRFRQWINIKVMLLSLGYYIGTSSKEHKLMLISAT